MIDKYLQFLLVIHATNALYLGDSCVLNHDDSPGICTIDRHCTIVQSMLRCKRIRPTICGFEGSQSILCCPLNKTNFENCNGNYQELRISERISVQKCREYSRCNPNFRRRKRQFGVSGGLETLLGEYPHMVAIGWILKGGEGYAWNCGGSLISEFWVVTAAHCTHALDDIFLTSKPNIVRLGEHNLKENGETEVQDVEIERIINHPGFKPPLKYHDIALLRMKNQAVFKENVRPICLWQTTNIISTTARVTGWGRVGFNDNPSDFLQSAEIDLFDLQSCKTFYKDPRRNLPNGIIDEQLCAGDKYGGKDTCQGDSGGPLQIINPGIFCTFYLIGITSFGVGCGGINSPAVYTRISSYVDWIESIVWQN